MTLEKIKVVVTDYIETDLRWEEEELAKYDNVIFEHYQLKFAEKDELISKIKDADVIVVNMAPMTADVIDSLEKCKLIIRHGIGYDNVDLASATRKGIRVANIPDYCAEEVAEQAIMLIMATWRGAFRGRKILEESSANGYWDFSTLPPIYRLSGKTLGIIGCGRIGSLVYKKMKGFNMNYLINDPYMSDTRREKLEITKLVSIEKVLKESDIVTIHTPLNAETHHLMSDAQFDMMKETAIFVNTARAGLVDTEALVRALKENKIAGAGIDVYDKEPPSPDCELFKLENATLSPHLGWCSVEAGWDIREKILGDILRHLDGKPPRFTVNPDVERVINEMEV
jgi:D-3-phosphoglycerate dehydrogenase